jgi:hypothetical protein
MKNKKKKIKAKEERLKEVERQISNLSASGYSFRDTMGFRSEMGQLRKDLQTLKGEEPVMHVTYKYGCEPGASRFRQFMCHVYDKLPIFEILVTVVLIFAAIGLLTVLRWLISFFY